MHYQPNPRSRRILLFARNFLKYPKLLGSLVPSSPFLVNQLMSKVVWQRAQVVVEYGPGIGNITREILQRMRPDAVLVAIELNSEFVEYLRDEIRDPRLHVVYGSASEVGPILARLIRAIGIVGVSGAVRRPWRLPAISHAQPSLRQQPPRLDRPGAR